MSNVIRVIDSDDLERIISIVCEAADDEDRRRLLEPYFARTRAEFEAESNESG